MKIRITFEVDYKDRRAIAHQGGGTISDYEGVKTWIEKTVRSDLEVIRLDPDFLRTEEP